MPNYTLANLVKAQIKVAGEFAANDNRYRNPAIFFLFLNSTNGFFPRAAELRTSEKRQVEANYFKRSGASLSTGGRSHNHTGNKGDSGVITIAWQTYSTTFSTSLKQADSSAFSFQEQFNNEIRQKVIDFADGFDAVSSTTLFNARSGVNPAAVKGVFNTTDDVYRITRATFASESITITKVVMDINKYQNTRLAIVCDSFSYTTFLAQAAQGATNATNTSFQFLGTYFVHDASLGAKAVTLNALYNQGFWMAVPENYIGVLDWIPQQNRRTEETSVNMYGNLRNPVDGLLYAAHSYETRADGTATNGETQDVVTQMELSIDLSFNIAPSSVVNETPIQAFAWI
jgi:hypothetical protein